MGSVVFVKLIIDMELRNKNFIELGFTIDFALPF
jgi:hypothetical protein